MKLSHSGACVSVDLSNFGSSFTHYTAMHHCAYESIGLSSSMSIARLFHSLWCSFHHHFVYESIGLSSSISIARLFHSLWCNFHHHCAFVRVQLPCCHFFFHSNALPTSTTGVIIFHWNCVYVRCFSVPSLSVVAFLARIPMHYPCKPLLLYVVNLVFVMCVAMPPCFVFCCLGGFDPL